MSLDTKTPLILVLAPRYPYPPTDGHQLRTYNLFKHFSDGYRFHFLTFGDDQVPNDREKAIHQLGPCFEDVIIVPESSLTRVSAGGKFSKITNIAYPSMISLGLPYYSTEMFDTVNRLVNSRQYDLVFFAGYTMFWYFYKTSSPVPYIVDILDSPALAMKSYMRTQKGFKRKIESYLQYLWSRRYEKVHFPIAKNIIFISAVDFAFSRKRIGQSQAWVVPNGVDTEYFKPDRSVSVEPHSMLFTGVMDFEPNKQAAIYFMNEVLPLIVKQEPKATLTIVGRNPDNEIRALARKHPNVKVTGLVEDIRRYFDEASVYVCPLLSGAGVKNKILEAWAMEKPIVATSISCEGLDAVNGENVIMADTPQDFASATLSLLSDAGRRKKLGVSGRKCAEGRYSWEAQALALDAIIKELLWTHGKSNRTLG